MGMEALDYIFILTGSCCMENKHERYEQGLKYSRMKHVLLPWIVWMHDLMIFWVQLQIFARLEGVFGSKTTRHWRALLHL